MLKSAHLVVFYVQRAAVSVVEENDKLAWVVPACLVGAGGVKARHGGDLVVGGALQRNRM